MKFGLFDPTKFELAYSMQQRVEIWEKGRMSILHMLIAYYVTTTYSCFDLKHARRLELIRHYQSPTQL